MLETIKITNLALISKSVINFGNGFNVLTGETGAGKSLIVDALLFLTGIRADKTLIKSGEEYARVEGVFSVDLDNSDINEILNTLDLDNEGTIIISRYFSLSGKNECRVNGEIVTLNILKKLSSILIDIFGQNDSQVLLDSNNHLTLLDNMFEDKLSVTKDILSDNLEKLKNINNSIYELGGLDSDRENNIKLIEFQIEEIESAKLEIGLEEDIKNKIAIYQNSEKIYSGLNLAIESLYGEVNTPNIIKSAINTLNSIDEFDDRIKSEKERLYSVKYELDDIISNINSIHNSINYSENELDSLQDRLTEIKDLERKYGNTISDVLEAKNKLCDKLDILKNADEKLEQLRIEKQKILKEVYNNSLELHNIRVRESELLKVKLISELQKLGMKNANFDVAFKNEINLENIESTVSIDGADSVEFLFSANLGVEVRPLTKIISGGEMSRFMLAFKSIQNTNSIKTCIFDEIDTGIGGEIGVIIGKKICDISANSQVICITHLAQIASFGDSNFKIEKYEDDGKTITNVRLLKDEEKVSEIARMIGDSQKNSSISHAKEIIEDAIEYKRYINHRD